MLPLHYEANREGKCSLGPGNVNHFLQGSVQLALGLGGTLFRLCLASLVAATSRGFLGCQMSRCPDANPDKKKRRDIAATIPENWRISQFGGFGGRKAAAPGGRPVICHPRSARSYTTAPGVAG